MNEPPARRGDAHAGGDTVRGRGGKPFRIETLPDDVRLRYERDVAGNPKTTAKAARQWLAELGFAVSLAAVLRHRARLVQANRERARAAAVKQAIFALARQEGLRAEDLAVGERLRAEHRLFEEVHAAFRTLNDLHEPAPPERIAALARALRLLLERDGGE